MKKLLALTILSLSVCSVNAENLFQTNNPFPQTVPQSMNNIYESDPAVMQREQEQKPEKKSWFKRKSKIQQTESSNYVIPESKIINEGEKGVYGTKDGSFYVFK